MNIKTIAKDMAVADLLNLKRSQIDRSTNPAEKVHFLRELEKIKRLNKPIEIDVRQELVGLHKPITKAIAGLATHKNNYLHNRQALEKILNTLVESYVGTCFKQLPLSDAEGYLESLKAIFEIYKKRYAHLMWLVDHLNDWQVWITVTTAKKVFEESMKEIDEVETKLDRVSKYSAVDIHNIALRKFTNNLFNGHMDTELFDWLMADLRELETRPSIDIKLVNKRLKEVIGFRDICFAYNHMMSWMYWTHEIEMLEALKVLYRRDR